MMIDRKCCLDRVRKRKMMDHWLDIDVFDRRKCIVVVVGIVFGYKLIECDIQTSHLRYNHS